MTDIVKTDDAVIYGLDIVTLNDIYNYENWVGINRKLIYFVLSYFMDNKKGMYIKVGVIVGSLALTYFLAVSVVPKVLVTFTKAAPASIISLTESRVLGEKILAKADGEDKNIINVYILDKEGKGVADKEVMMEGSPNIEPKSMMTNSEGKSTFSLTSKVEEQVMLSASVGGSPLQKQIKVTFRN